MSIYKLVAVFLTKDMYFYFGYAFPSFHSSWWAT